MSKHPQSISRIMLSREGKEKGEITNLHFRKCQLEGCTGWRIRVVWQNGRITLPCECGCVKIDDNTYQIL